MCANGLFMPLPPVQLCRRGGPRPGRQRAHNRSAAQHLHRRRADAPVIAVGERAQNAVLLRSGAAALSEARRRFQAAKQPVQNFDAFAYAAEGGPQERHVVRKAEVNEHGANPRFVVTSPAEFAPALLSHAYCERGQWENFIKDFKNALQADRLSCSTFAANFFRLLEHAAASALLHALRTHIAPLAPQLGRAQFDTLRLQLLKVAALVSQSARRLLVRLPAAFPLAPLFRPLASMLAAPPVLSSA